MVRGGLACPVLLAAALAVGLGACGGADDDANAGDAGPADAAGGGADAPVMPGDGAPGPDAAPPVDAAIDASYDPGWYRGPDLPEPIANNAVAAIDDGGHCTVYTALGIDATRAYSGIHSRAFRWTVGDASWQALPPVPGSSGRIAGSAVAVRGLLYVIGGYSVAASGSETSFTSVLTFDPAIDDWRSAASLLRPIDDAAAVVWRDRWIIVISGWSNTSPVDDVQIYDIEDNQWRAATDFPGTPVFGHSAAIVNDELIVIDGVGSGPGGFALVNQTWRGQLDPADPTNIAWSSLGAHPGSARYRAAAGTAGGAVMLFSGGTSDPYNYDGLSYDTGNPSAPLGDTLAYDTVSDAWVTFGLTMPAATMDHRALAGCGNRLFLVGGMTAGPSVTANVWWLVPE